MTSSVSSVSHSPLSPSDISRLPQGAAPQLQPSATQGLQEDTYGEPKSNTLRNTLIGVVVAAAALVGLKRWGGSLVKFDPNNMKWYDHIKKVVVTTADYIEKPFIWTYSKVKGWFGKGNAAEVAEEAAEAAGKSGTEATGAAAGAAAAGTAV